MLLQGDGAPSLKRKAEVDLEGEETEEAAPSNTGPSAVPDEAELDIDDA